jgi:hypothetical protein
MTGLLDGVEILAEDAAYSPAPLVIDRVAG